MTIVTIDFETFSKVNLKNTGAARYAIDDSTEVICLGYSIDDDEPLLWKALNDRKKQIPDDLHEAVVNGAEIHAFNAYFEYLIWYHICVKRYGWPRVKFKQWRDTQALAAYFALPQSLDDCGRALGLNIVKDPKGSRLINKLCKPRKPSKNNPATRWVYDACPQDYEDFYEYCLQDVRAEVALRKALPQDELPAREMRLWRLTMTQNIRGLPIDVELVDNVIRMLKAEDGRLTKEVIELTGGEVTTGGQLARMIDWCGRQGVHLMSMTADAIESKLSDPGLPVKVRRLLELRQLLSRASVKKFVKMKESICPDGRIHGCLRYHTAPTGRWGGALIQPHNMPRETVKDVDHVIRAFATLTVEEFRAQIGDVSTTATAMVRPSICAPEGMEIYDGDYSSIENCTVLWLADDQPRLDLIRNGEDLYVDMATRLYPGSSYDWIKTTYEANKVAYNMRRHGKLTILGSVYGMGWKTFMATCEDVKFPITEKEAKHTIDIFRETYAPVVNLWYGLEDAAKESISNPGAVTRYNRVRFLTVHEDNYLYMILPNGKRISYPQPGIEWMMTPWGKEKKTITHGGWVKIKNPDRNGSSRGNSSNWGRVGLSPGRLTENASQALAREILCDGLLALEDNGYDTILSVHDEPVALMPEKSSSLDDFIKTMCQMSKHHKTIPVRAGGYIGRRFKK